MSRIRCHSAYISFVKCRAAQKLRYCCLLLWCDYSPQHDVLYGSRSDDDKLEDARDITLEEYLDT